MAGMLHPFERERDALTHTNAHGGERELATVPLQLFDAVSARRAPDMPSGWPRAIAPPLGLTLCTPSGSRAGEVTASPGQRRPRSTR